MKDKKGGVGETVTWIVAFLIIFVIMFIFFLFSQAIASEPISFEISAAEDRLEYNKNIFYGDVPIEPEKIKFVKKFQDETK